MFHPVTIVVETVSFHESMKLNYSKITRHRATDMQPLLLSILLLVATLVVASQQTRADQTTVVSNLSDSSNATPSPTTPPAVMPSSSTIPAGITITTTTQLPTQKVTRKGGSVIPSPPDCPKDCVYTNKKALCSSLRGNAFPNFNKCTQFTEFSFINCTFDELDFNLFNVLNIESLDVTNCSIKTIIAAPRRSDAFAKLKTLNLSGNRISSISNLSSWKFPSMETLDLTKNPTAEINQDAFSRMKILKNLKLGQTKQLTLHELAFQPLNQLVNLTLSGAGLTRINDKQFSANTKLDSLDLSHNNLPEVPAALRQIPSISNLLLNHNSVRSLRQADFIGFSSSLVYLDISDCSKLTKIDEYTFSDMSKLKILKLSNNPMLSFISENAFASESNNIQLDILDLSYCNLATLANIKHLPVNQDTGLLSFIGNPLDCSCVNLIWLESIEKAIYTSIHCSTPAQYKDMERSQVGQWCKATSDSNYIITLAAFLLFLFVLLVAVLIQKSDIIQQLRWRDRYGTIYYTKTSFPPEHA